MTEFPIAVTSGNVGRPPLSRVKDDDTKPTMVRLTVRVRARIEALVGENQMAAFIRAAVEAELARREGEMGGEG